MICGYCSYYYTVDILPPKNQLKMDKKAAFLSVTVITLLGLYLTHTIYTNTIAVHQKNVPTQAPKRVNLTPIKSDLREIIRNATAVEKERTHKEKCSVEFKCQNGE